MNGYPIGEGAGGKSLFGYDAWALVQSQEPAKSRIQQLKEKGYIFVSIHWPAQRPLAARGELAKPEGAKLGNPEARGEGVE